MLNFLKKLLGIGKPKTKGGCPHCGGKLVRTKADVSETYGKPVMACSKCKRLIEL